MGRRAAIGTRKKEGFLSGGWSPGGEPRDHGRGCKPGVPNFWRRREQRHRRRRIKRQRPVDWLVAQMTDGAGCFRRVGGVMMANADERHADQQQRKQRYRDN
jgi:hypothetical protein